MRIRIDSEGRDVTDLYGLHDESDTILEVGMFENWKVGQTGWVRLRNGKVARAIQFGHDAMPVQIQFMKGDELSWTWVENSGLGSETSAIAHLPNCTGFDWEEPPAPHQWKIGDWFVVDEVPERYFEGPGFAPAMDELIGVPQCVDKVDSCGNLKAKKWRWHPSWCRPCAQPKAAPTRFQPSIEYVGIHDAI